MVATAKALADMGWKAAFEADEGFAKGLNVHEGQLLHAGVAEALFKVFDLHGQRGL